MEKEYDDAMAISNQEMVDRERTVHCHSRSWTRVVLLHQKSCLIVTPTKAELCPSLSATLIWNFSLLICFSFLKNAKPFAKTSLVIHHKLYFPVLNTSQECRVTFLHDGSVNYLSAHKEHFRCPQLPSYCHPNTFSCMVTCHPDPAVFPVPFLSSLYPPLLSPLGR